MTAAGSARALRGKQDGQGLGLHRRRRRRPDLRGFRGQTLPGPCTTDSDRTAGKHYRLLSEAEWEYAERAGSITEYWWGYDPGQMCRYANGPDLAAGKTFPQWTGLANCDDGHDFAAPVASYAPNPFGLYDTAGNVWEWTEDCYRFYTVQPTDGTPTERADCQRRTLRGGSWVRGLADLRSSQRNGLPRPDQRGGDIGFRVARDL